MTKAVLYRILYYVVFNTTFSGGKNLNDSRTAVLVDSGCDLGTKLAEQYQIKVVRLKVIYPEKVYEDGLDIDPMEVYRRFPDVIPKTSTPNVTEVEEVIKTIREEGYKNIIGITISSGLSGTNNVFRLAFSELKDMGTFLFDTKNISIGAGIYAVWTAQKLAEGWSFEETSKELEKKQHDSRLCYYMNTLDYLAKGGRITPSIAIVGKILHLKPIISCNNEGIYYTAAIIRGAAKGMSKLIDMEAEAARSMKGKLWATVMNGDAQSSIPEVTKMLFEKIMLIVSTNPS